MDFDRETKSIIAAVALVAAFAVGMNGLVGANAEPQFMSWSIGLFVVAVIFWIWIRRDDMAENRESAIQAAEDAAKRAEDLAKAAQDKAAAQLDDVAQKVEVVADEVKDSTEQIAEVIEEEVETVAETVEEVVEAEPEPVASDEPDDLSKIEGIGPVYQQLLKDAGVGTFAMIASKSTEDLEKIIKDAGKRRPASIETWVEQAELAAKGDWDALQKLQDTLDGGRRTS